MTLRLCSAQAAGLTQVLADGEHTYLYGIGGIGESVSANWAYHNHDGLGSLRQLTDAEGSVTQAKSYLQTIEGMCSQIITLAANYSLQ